MLLIADIPGSRVYSDGPTSRCNTPMLKWQHAKGFYLISGRPNTTYLIQDTDQSHIKK